MNKIKMKKIQNRNFVLEREAKSEDAADRNVRVFSFASETPYERWWGIEILSMKEGAMDISRLLKAGPLLFNHNRDLHLGAIEKVWFENGKAYCQVRFSSNKFAQEKLRDLDDGILVNVSFGYVIDIKKGLKKLKEEDGVPTFLVTKFMGYEISLCTIPADVEVGVGRDEENTEVELSFDDVTEKTSTNPEPPNQTTVIENKKNLTIEGNRMEELEKLKNENQIRKMAVEHNAPPEMVQRFITEGKTAGEFGIELARHLGGEIQHLRSSNLKLTDSEQKAYSLTRAFQAAMSGNWEGAGFERELSEELATRNHRVAQGSSFFIPTSIRAAYAAGTQATGGQTIQTDRDFDIIDALRSKLVLRKAGATFITGLKGLIQIPKSNGETVMYWVDEAGEITQSESTFKQVSLNPKRAGVYSEYTKQFLMQSSADVEAFVRNELSSAIAQGLDIAGLRGTGVGNQPKGILNFAGIGSVVGGVNGAGISEDHVIDLETAIVEANAETNDMVYIATGKLVGSIKKLRDATTGAKVFDPNVKPTREGAIGVLNGLDLFRTNNLVSNGTKGTGVGLSQIICGDFTQMLIGQWGDGIEIEVNPYADFKKGIVGMRAHLFSDVALRHEGAFSASSDLK